MAFCSNCGASLQDSSMFCPGCGKRVAPVTDAPADAAASVIAPVTSAPANAGLSDNLAGLLAYFLVPAVLFLLVEPFNRNRFVRFHSFQCIYLAVFWFALCFALAIVGSIAGYIPFVGSLLFFVIDRLIGLAGLVVGLYLMYSAYQGKMAKLPVLGEMAEKRANAM